jgi:hypothetical protein
MDWKGILMYVAFFGILLALFAAEIYGVYMYETLFFAHSVAFCISLFLRSELDSLARTAHLPTQQAYLNRAVEANEKL